MEGFLALEGSTKRLPSSAAMQNCRSSNEVKLEELSFETLLSDR